MTTKLFLYRGIPGSGKSTAARLNPEVDFVVEADQYFEVEPIKPGITKKYFWSSGYVERAHERCFMLTKKLLEEGYTVAVANTFTRMWELQNYVGLAVDMGVDFKIIRCTGNYGNIHNVPDEVVTSMEKRFQDYPGEILIG